MSELSGTARVILGFLACCDGLSGYEIKQHVDRSTRFFFSASYGQLYPELRRLESSGLVTGTADPLGARQRTVYRITEQGEARVTEWLRSADGPLEMRDEGMLKLFFASVLPPAERVAVAARIRLRHETALAELEAVKAGLPDSVDGPSRLVLEWGLGLHRWVASWCADAEGLLRDAATITERSGS